MNKTPMQEIDELIFELWQSDEISEDVFTKLRNAVTYSGIEKEKQMVIDAYKQGFNDNDSKIAVMKPTLYFDKTFNQ